MKRGMLLSGLLFLILSTSIVSAQNQGAKEIVIDGGNMGNITLPHRMHQTILDDCMICHSDFAKKSGELMASKKAGLLKRKQVMDETCLKCHKERKKIGEKYGPIRCSGCHVR